jgi:arachidonate 15-lipoxygenase
MTTPLLPQHDPRSTERTLAINSAKERYRFTHDIYPGVALALEVPKEEDPPAAWSAVINGALKVVLENLHKSDRLLGGRSGWAARIGDAKTTLKDFVRRDFATAAVDLASMLLAGDTSNEAAPVADYSAIFQAIAAPELVNHLNDDAAFSRRVIAGANPESLERVTARDPAFPVTDAMIAAVSPGDTWQSAMTEGRLYLADYGMLVGAPPNEFGGPARHVQAPRALFIVKKNATTPSICAIQIGRTPSPTNPIFSPSHGWAWEMAKTHVAVADTLVGAIWFHHARTHLVAEPAILAAHRSFAPNHPLLVLLQPHFLGTLHINHLGAKTVFPDHGILDWFTGTTQPAARAVTAKSVQSFNFSESIYPRRLKSRGVDDSEVLKEFPFRDDGLLVWDALLKWIDSYVKLYYASDEDVFADSELQSWLRQWSETDGGGIRGIGEGGFFRTRTVLTETLTQLIFSCSALHASMNFPVQVEMTVVPNSPFAAYAPPPTRTDGYTEDDWRRTLPPLDQTQRQFGVALLLGMARYGQLDTYPEGTFADARVTPLLRAYRARLAEVEAEINTRNVTRTPYIHLLPSRIPQSINI